MTPETALARWAAMLTRGREDGYRLVRLAEEDGTTAHVYIPARPAPCLGDDCLTRIALRRPVDLAMGMTLRTVREPEAVRNGFALWVCIDGTVSNRILERFRLKPAIVLREGDTSRRTLVWPLQAPVLYEWLARCNKRLARHFRAPKVACAAEALLPPPGAYVLGNRATPVPIVVERFEALTFPVKDVVGWLPDALERRWQAA